MKATGIAGDPGDLLLSSSHGMILGNPAGSLLAAAGGLKLGALRLNLAALDADWAELTATGDSTSGSIVATGIKTATTTKLQAGASIGIGTLEIGTALTSQAGTTTAFDAVSAGTGMDIQSGGQIAITTAAAATGSAKVVSTGGGVTLGTLSTGTAADIQANGDIAATSMTAGTRIDSTTTNGTISIGKATSGGNANLAAGGDIDVETAVIGSGLTSIAGGATRFVSLTAGTSIDINSVGTVVIDTSEAVGGSASIASSAGAVTLGTLTTGQDTLLRAANIMIDTAKAGTSFTATATDFLEAESIREGELIAINNSGTVRIHNASAIQLVLDGGLAFDADEIRLRDRADIAADEIQIGRIVHTGSAAPLVLDVTGRGSGAAKRLDAFVSSIPGVAIGDYRVADSAIQTDGSLLSIARGVVAGTMTVRTALRTIFMNNQRAIPVTGNDVQLFQPDFGFRLLQEGYRTTTDAFIVQFGEGSEVFYQHAGLVYAGMSMVRELDRILQSSAHSSQQPAGQGSLTIGVGNGLTGITVAVVAEFLRLQTQDSMLVRESEERPAVNLGGAVAGR